MSTAMASSSITSNAGSIPFNQIILNNLYKLDLKLDEEFQEFPKFSSLDNVDVLLLKNEMMTDLENQLQKTKLKSFYDLEIIWTWISTKRIHNLKDKISLNRHSLVKRNSRQNLMKFVKVASVVGITVTYMVTVSVLALGVLAGAAMTILPNPQKQ